MLNDLNPVSYRHVRRELKSILEWLWQVAVGSVLDELGFDKPPSNNQWPRVWWIANGWLNFLSIHAAGYHGKDSTRNTLDRVISSYATTIRSLGYARECATKFSSSTCGKMLIMHMPRTPKMALSKAKSKPSLISFRNQSRYINYLHLQKLPFSRSCQFARSFTLLAMDLPTTSNPQKIDFS